MFLRIWWIPFHSLRKFALNNFENSLFPFCSITDFLKNIFLIRKYNIHVKIVKKKKMKKLGPPYRSEYKKKVLTACHSYTGAVLFSLGVFELLEIYCKCCWSKHSDNIIKYYGTPTLLWKTSFEVHNYFCWYRDHGAAKLVCG